MSLPSKRWNIAPAMPSEQAAPYLDRDLPLWAGQVLYNRGIRTPEQVRAFLDHEFVESNPFKMKGVPEAVSRVQKALRHDEPIAVFGDFDVDGVTATALLVEVLQAAGGRVVPYIPHRVDEGYGLSVDALRDLWARGVRLVITVDCGIRSVEEVARASKGLDIILTDHHSVGETVPPAVAVINPKQQDCPYPFKDLAGVGVAYKLAQAFLRMREAIGKPVPLSEERLLEMVALGTVADLTPLVGENRTLVRRGLEAMNQSPRPGVEALMAQASVRRGEVDATSISFRLGPRLNAAGRLESAMLAYDLLTCQDLLQTQKLARRLDELNRTRQTETEEAVARAEAQVQATDPGAYLYFAADPAFKPGIVGLAAGRLTEAHYRPSVVVEQKEQESRGSCRSIAEFHITRALDACSDLLIRHGGHAAAAGFTVATDRLEELRDRLQAMAKEQLAGQDLRPMVHIDVECDLHALAGVTTDHLGLFEPCGMDNPRPVFLSRAVQVSSRKTMGAQGQHLKLDLLDSNGAKWDAVAFGFGSRIDALPERIDIAYTKGVNDWNHQQTVQLLVEDIRPAGSGEGMERL